MHQIPISRFVLLIFASTPLLTKNSNCWETGRFSTLVRNDDKTSNVLVFDQWYGHSEVRFAIFQALLSVPIRNLQITFRRNRYREILILDEIVKGSANFSANSNHTWKQHRTLHNFVEKRNNPQWTVILPSFDFGSYELYRSYKPNPRDHETICVAHHSKMRNYFSESHIRRLSNFNYTFLTLSHHVTTGLGKYLKTVVNHPPPTFTFPPVFKYNSSEQFGKNWLKPRVVIQGGVSMRPRNYRAIFNSMKKYSRQFPQIKLQLVGAYKPQLRVPRDISKNVERHSGLPYSKYYDLISRAIAIFPAFETRNTYLTSRASSTIPVTIITCVPMVADEKMLKAYTYLNPSVVWYRKDNETEMDTLIRYFKQENFQAVFEEKRQLLYELRESLIKQNGALLEKIIFKT